MVEASAGLNGSGNQAVWVHTHLSSQDINGNYSTYYGEVRYYGNGWGSWTNNTQYWSANFGGFAYNGTFTIPYANRNDSYAVLGAWYFNHAHNADGTKGAWTLSATIDTDHTSIGDGTASTTEGAPPTIPRASTPSFVGGSSLTTGTAVTINTNWASSGFTHNASWAFGTLSGQTGGFSASTGIGASFTWTPPVTMLAQIPNSASGNGTLYLDTYSGGTLIGSKNIGFTLTAAGSVIPTISSVTIADQNATVVAQVGAYVQSLSSLKGTVNSAGVQGSTIASSNWSMSGSTVDSGATITPMTSGTVAIGAATTDTRGRTASYSSSVTVMPYVPPKINSAQVRRATALGALNDNGTSLQLDLNAASQSLVVGTEKNSLIIKVFTRVYGTTPWTARNSFTHTAVAYNTNVLITGGAIFPANQSFDVKIEVTDKFNAAQPTTSLIVVSTAAIFMHWSQTGVGIGKYHTQGTLDVLGNIYQSNNLVLDTSDVASAAVVATGTDNAAYISPARLYERLPPGIIVPYGGATAPTGWLLCDGAAVSRTTYARLFTLFGTSYGTGDGSTTFNLPNLKGRVPIGLDSTQAEFDVRGETGGGKTHNHNEGDMRAAIGASNGNVTALSYVAGPVHARGPGTTGAYTVFGSSSSSAAYGWNHYTGVYGFTSTESSLQPYLVLNYIVLV